MRISRPCYAKSTRCPGWVGPGWKHNPDGKDWCTSAIGGGRDSVQWDWNSRFSYFKFGRCSVCKTWVLPFFTRYFDPTWWKHPTQPLWAFLLELRIKRFLRRLR